MSLPRRASDAMTPAVVSGTHPFGIGRLRAAMLRYISPILVDSVMKRAMDLHGKDGLGSNALQAITEECMVGLRLFVKEEQLPHLMLELAQILEEEA
jgi:hypothetical protein